MSSQRNRLRYWPLFLLPLLILGFPLFPKEEVSPEPRPGDLVEVATKDVPSAAKTVGHPSFLSPHASPVLVSDGMVYVTNTPADTIDVIDTATGKIDARIPVGIDPVGLALRPDGKELWVANHISDSVSVIDLDPRSPTYRVVVDTIQQIDAASRSTRFDEPVGIAFASNTKAYVSLSSENEIAVVDVASRKVTRKLTIRAQDPRAIRVQGGRLYVLPFESNNKTQLSGGTDDKFDGDLDTFNAHNHSIANNNILSLGHVLDIVKHPDVPDRDLFVFDTETDKLVETVDTLGTLLYGLTVDSKGRVFVAQTDARNEVNGRAGTKGHGLAELGNRAFLNQITRVGSASEKAERKTRATFFDLEPVPPADPAPGEALATPYAVELLPGDRTLVASAAASDQIFTVDADSGHVLGRVEVGAVPRGIAVEEKTPGKPRAWVLNAVDNSLSLVDLANPASPTLKATIALEDPTHPIQKKGRILFETAASSTTESFSCASCHPDGHTDQLLWVLKTPIVTGGKQIQPRSTMPLRGLRETAPFHWDGIPGDPYGGNNSASLHKPVAPNSSVDDPLSQTGHLVEGGLATTMMRVGSGEKNDAGKEGRFSREERAALSAFMLDIPYPPAQRRAYTNALSEQAQKGFDLFHIQGNNEPDKPKPNVCGDCHRMPYLVSTNTPGSGMDAPTWRGAYDRWLILPQGRLNIIDFGFFRRVAEKGTPERDMWRFSWQGIERFDPVWDMVLEMSTGWSGAFARQTTLNKRTAGQPLTKDLVNALEAAAAAGSVVLQVEGVAVSETGAVTQLVLQFHADYRGGQYVETSGAKRAFSRDRLVEMARIGRFVGTFTGRHGEVDDYDSPPPALWTRGTLHAQVGRQKFPVVDKENLTLEMSGRHLLRGAQIHVDGRHVDGEVLIEKGDLVTIELAALPEGNGMHFLQVQNPDGHFSNDMIFHVGEVVKTGADQLSGDELSRQLSVAIAEGSLERVRKLLEQGAEPTARNPDDGNTPLSTASFHGELEIGRHLIKKGAKVDATNRDGNIPLHVAAFLCRNEIVDLLVEHGSPPAVRNGRGERPIDTVTGAWSDGLADFYRTLDRAGNLGLDIGSMEAKRARMAEHLLGLERDAGSP